jgi:hypothetical protein
MKPLHLAYALLGTVAAASTSLDVGWLTDSGHWMRSLFRNEAGTFDASATEGRIAARMLAARREVHRGALEPDPELRAWLARRVEKGALDDLDALTESVRGRFPHYVRLSVCALQSPSIDDLLQKAFEWSHQTDKSFTHYAIIARTKPAHLGFECVVLTGQRLRDFEPEELSSGHESFYIMCPLCRQGQACEIPVLMRSISLDCPHCHRPYAMLAVDTKGRYRHVHEFLTGYAPPAHFPAGINRLNEMLLIWNSVIQGVRYVPDTADGNDANDAWQTAAETQRLGTGDCEDSSIYLADWLIARGFEARVALGHYAERGGHAWVMVRLEGRTYLLESTSSDVDTSRPPLLKDVGARYVPDAMVDRAGFYTRRKPSAPWDGDYWSELKWQQVKPNPKPSLASVKPESTQEKRANSDGPAATGR